jgi:hypothetical protein
MKQDNNFSRSWKRLEKFYHIVTEGDINRQTSTGRECDPTMFEGALECETCELSKGNKMLNVKRGRKITGKQILFCKGGE